MSGVFLKIGDVDQSLMLLILTTLVRNWGDK